MLAVSRCYGVGARPRRRTRQRARLSMPASTLRRHVAQVAATPNCCAGRAAGRPARGPVGGAAGWRCSTPAPVGGCHRPRRGRLDGVYRRDVDRLTSRPCGSWRARDSSNGWRGETAWSPPERHHAFTFAGSAAWPLWLLACRALLARWLLPAALTKPPVRVPWGQPRRDCRRGAQLRGWRGALGWLAGRCFAGAARPQQRCEAQLRRSRRDLMLALDLSQTGRADLSSAAAWRPPPAPPRPCSRLPERRSGVVSVAGIRLARLR